MLDELRYETRFNVPADQLQLACVVLENNFLVMPFSGQIVETVYFGTRELNVPKSCFVRTRRYLPEGVERFELKGENDGIVTKQGSCQKVGEVANDLARIDLHGGVDLLVRRGVDPKTAGSVLEEIEFKPLLPLVETVSRRLYFGDGKLRVTLDEWEECWGYFGEERRDRVLLRRNEMGRLEFKTESREEAEVAIGLLIRAGIDLLITESRKKEFQRLYFAHLKHVRQRNEAEVFTNEMPGVELERKLQVLEMEDPLTLVDLLHKDALDGSILGFGCMPGKEVIKEWEMDFINYGVESSDGTLEEEAVVVVDNKIDRYAIKKKGKSVAGVGKSMVRPEVLVEVFGKFDDVAETAFLRNLELETGCLIVKVGVVKRRKRYTYITNQETGRNCKVGVDVCRFGSHTMSQMEIEYMGRTGKHDLDGGELDKIEAEIDRLQSFLEDKYVGKLIHTTQTKFQWLLSLNKKCH